jgi:aspartyl-tRNA(Asn)/glutamyl-tRNA(Gln) amidotransferase subunit A
VVNKLISEDAIILGRANMDEFGMGSRGENSAFGATKNALDPTRVAGGSSSGSAVAVALDLCVAALGTDTGGSVRTPAHYNGLYAIKPTYGSVSRSGVIAYASSLEQVGPICKTLDDTALMLSVIQGHDILDATSINADSLDVPHVIPSETRNLAKRPKIAYIKELHKNFPKPSIATHEISIPNIDLVLSAYYIIATAEAASNLARYDGVKYTSRAQNCDDLQTLYKKTRSEFFGTEVKRRIMLGNFVLSSGYFDAYYNKAKQVQSSLKEEFKKVFAQVDLIAMPIMPFDIAPAIATKQSPVAEYLADLFTITANAIGCPSVALPNNLQLMGPHGSDSFILEVAKCL